MLRRGEHCLKRFSLYWRHKVVLLIPDAIIQSYTQFLGITRASLQLAWDFSTASEGCLTDRLLYMRDDAFKRIGDNGKYVVVRVENNYSKDIYRYDTVIFLG